MVYGFLYFSIPSISAQSFFSATVFASLNCPYFQYNKGLIFFQATFSAICQLFQATFSYFYLFFLFFLHFTLFYPLVSNTNFVFLTKSDEFVLYSLLHVKKRRFIATCDILKPYIRRPINSSRKGTPVGRSARPATFRCQPSTFGNAAGEKSCPGRR